MFFAQVKDEAVTLGVWADTEQSAPPDCSRANKSTHNSNKQSHQTFWTVTRLSGSSPDFCVNEKLLASRD